MLHLFQETFKLFEELKAKVEGAANAATTAVSSGTSWTPAEIQSAKVAVFSAVETTSMTLAQAFEEGAKWAAARVQDATANAAPAAAATAPAAAPVAQAAPVAEATPAAAPAAEAAPATEATPTA